MELFFFLKLLQMEKKLRIQKGEKDLVHLECDISKTKNTIQLTRFWNGRVRGGGRGGGQEEEG